MNTTTTTASVIAATLSAHGESGMLDMAQRVAGIESNGRADAKNNASSATGLFQFTRPTWEGVMPNVPFSQATDPRKNTEAFIKLTRQNQEHLENALGRKPQDWETYMAHFAGPGTAVKLLKADDGASLSSIFSDAAMAANPHLGRLGSVGRYKQWVQAKYNGSSLPDGIPVAAGSGIGDDEDHFGDDELGRRMMRQMNGFNGNDNQLLELLVGMVLLFMGGLQAAIEPKRADAPAVSNPNIDNAQEQARSVAVPDGCAISTGVCLNTPNVPRPTAGPLIS